MLQFDVSNDPADIALLRTCVLSVATLFRLSEVATDDLIFIASELVSNVIEHAGTGSVVTLLRSGTLLRVSVADYSTELPRRRSDESLCPSSLALVEEMSMRWGCTEHGATGKTVWATLDLRQR